MPVTAANEPLSSDTVARGRTTIVVVAPLVLLAAFLYHPHILFLPDADAVAHAFQGDAKRWGIAHLGVSIGATLMSLAYVAIRGWLREAGENRWSARALPLLMIGSGLYAFLPGREFTVMAAAKTGADIAASQRAVDPWFTPTIMMSALTNALGLVALIIGFRRSRVLDAPAKSVVLTALGVMALARFVPIGFVQFHVQGLAGVVGLWTIAYAMERQAAAHGVAQARAMA